VLSTAQMPSGRISSRMISIKDVDGKGFINLSNFETLKKSKDLSTNQQELQTFGGRNWNDKFVLMAAPECEAFAKGRARNSRICDWASPQSVAISDRVELETEVQRVQERFIGVNEIPIPPFWGGLRVIPDVIEFWQGLVHLFVHGSV